MHTVEILAGPDSGRALTLTAGRHLIGRARTAAVRVADLAIEPHHVAVDLGADGTIGVTQLSGRFPVLVDAAPHRGGVLRSGAVLEVGATLLTIGAARTVPGGSRFEVLAGVERQAHLARGRAPWSVTLGYGEVRLPLPIDVAALSLPEQAAVASAERHRHAPVFADLAGADRRVLAVRGDEARRVIAAIVAQLPVGGDARRWTVTEDSTRRPCSRPVTFLVPVARGAELPERCDALVDLGANWHATFIPDLRSGGFDTVRLRVAGRPTPQPDCEVPQPAPVSLRPRRAFLDEVTRTGAALGGGIVGVPQPAGAE